MSQPQTLLTPHRLTRTHMRDSREVYTDTGRPVDEQLGSHVVLWIVEDPEAWANAIEAEGDQVLAAWVKSGRKWRAHGEVQRSQRYKSAARVRADGPQRLFHSNFHNYADANASAAELRRSHPNPGVRYEVAEITGAASCPDCRTPMIEADGQWRHHLAGFPVDCHWGRPEQPVDGSPNAGTVNGGSLTRAETQCSVDTARRMSRGRRRSSSFASPVTTCSELTRLPANWWSLPKPRTHVARERSLRTYLIAAVRYLTNCVPPTRISAPLTVRP